MHATLSLCRSLWTRTADPTGWAGPVALLSLPAVPAVAPAEALAWLCYWLGAAVRAARQYAARALRRAADVIDPPAEPEWDERWTPAPVASGPVAPPAPAAILPPTCLPVGPVGPVAPVMVMPSAARMTSEPVPRGCDSTDTPEPRPVYVDAIPIETPESLALARHGSIRAAARALGMAESTLRGRLRRQRS